MAEVKSLEVNQEAIESVDELEEELEVYEEIEIEELSIDGFCGVYWLLSNFKGGDSGKDFIPIATGGKGKAGRFWSFIL